MQKKNIDDVKTDFVLAVYESIQNQIRNVDLKVSLILSWDSITAVMLGREIASMIAGRGVNAIPVVLISIVIITLGLSGTFIFATLKPRIRHAVLPDFKGLLYTGDIMHLAKEAPGRIQTYLEHLGSIQSNEEIYVQFVSSIVSISEIVQKKNRMFLRALAATATSFSCLVGLIALVGAGSAVVN